MRVALYARFSSDLQNARSADDQLAALRQVVALRGWTEVAVYKDEAISGAALVTRPGVQALLAGGRAGAFDIVLAEALDRLSRDQEDTAHLQKRLKFAGVEIETLSEGRIGTMHVGLGGTMNQMFLEQLAHKTRRGLEARVRAGYSGGGRCYGYDLVDGKTGELTINDAEAAIVRRIFADYIAGRSPKAIAQALNAKGVAGPRGGTWSPSAIAGDRRAGDGILCQTLYDGVRIFNRRRYRKDPDTGRRSGVINPPSAWIRVPAPTLAILEPGTFAAAAAVAQENARPTAGGPRRKRPTRLLAGGLMRCGVCGGAMSLAAGKYCCGNGRDRGTCANTKVIRCETVEARVVDGVRRHLDAQGDVPRAAVRDRAPIERELAEVGRRIDRLLESYMAGACELAEFARANEPLKARRAALEARLAAAAAAPPVIRLHPRAADAYAALAAQLGEVLTADDAGEVRDAVRALLARVDFHPLPGLGQFGLTIEGRLADLLQIGASAADKEKPPALRTGVSTSSEVVLGAGARSGQNLTPETVTFAA
jgi:site-specific DNA recombinase